jgi:hypothetical protein
MTEERESWPPSGRTEHGDQQAGLKGEGDEGLPKPPSEKALKDEGDEGLPRGDEGKHEGGIG